jgi:hypothetical protein
MSDRSTNGEAPRPWYTPLRFPDFEVSWAGPHPYQQGFCFGSEDGRLLFSDEDGGELFRSESMSDSGEAINGVACSQEFLAITTRQEFNIWAIPRIGEGKPIRGVLHYGAHGVTVTPSGYFVAPLGPTGILSVKPVVGVEHPGTISHAAIEGLYYYRVIILAAADGREVLVCAGRRGGLAVTEFWGAKRGTQELGTISFDGLDVIDVCSLNEDTKPLAVAATGRDGKLILLQDVLHDKRPVTLKFEAIQGTVYRLLSCRGNLIVLTSKGLYVLAKFAERFVQGESMSQFPTHVLCLPMEAVDANLCLDRWLLVVMSDDVRKYDARLIQQSAPADLAPGEIRVVQPRALAPDWKRHDVKQETRQSAKAV